MELTLQEFLNIAESSDKFEDDIETLHEYIDSEIEPVKIEKEDFYGIKCYIDNIAMMRITTLDIFNEFCTDKAKEYIKDIIDDDVLSQYFDQDRFLKDSLTDEFLKETLISDYIRNYELVNYNNHNYVIFE